MAFLMQRGYSRHLGVRHSPILVSTQSNLGTAGVALLVCGQVPGCAPLAAQQRAVSSR